ncbi:hypothetical protein HBHAL_2622 [Halobacillus halophilus DSM 2266]|uniref:Uncharacterized protein n=1 Tax=Halobacillus halophilus (strain ATCC 35676 / DSM 2266 / JCM 20832 / KCTC 3685 / LMG 17431 / NBRC 102448 / NCIMB 2269) TaxID=866895 RepID=I0JLF3_HALH3|nr:hypothetical protein [Halobacillus halophilus]CCG44973.1 hypothetical protein HBHAL_2622 [Halobacillus halophilus DSM 2266]
MNDIVITVIIVLLVAGGWGAIILKDFANGIGKPKGNWVHTGAVIIFALLLIWIATSF